MCRSDPVADQMLKAKGFKPNSKGDSAPTHDYGERLVADLVHASDGNKWHREIEIRGSAYDNMMNEYVYCCLELGWKLTPFYGMIFEDSIREPKAKVGDQFKFRAASDTILTATINAVTYDFGRDDYDYHFDIERPKCDYLHSNEIEELIQKATKDSGIQHELQTEAKDDGMDTTG